MIPLLKSFRPFAGLLLVSNLTHVFQYLTQLLLGAFLSVEDFGIFNSVLSLTIIATMLISALPYIISKQIIQYQDDVTVQSIFVKHAFKKVVQISFVATLFFSLLSPWMKTFLKIDSIIPILIFWVIVFVITLNWFYIGVLQGLHQYFYVALQNSFMLGLRFVLCVILVAFLGYAYNAALLSSALAGVVTFIWALKLSGKWLPRASLTPQSTENTKIKTASSFIDNISDYIPITLHTLGFALLVNIDIPLVKHFCSEKDTGLYSAAALLGRIPIFLPSILLQVLFPQVVKKHSQSKSSLKETVSIFMITLLLNIPYVALMILFPEDILTSLFGERFKSASDIMPIITLGMAMVSILNIIWHFFMAKEMYSFLYPMYLGVGIIIIGIFLKWNGSYHEIAHVFLWGIGSMLLLTLGLVYQQHHREINKIVRGSLLSGNSSK